MKLKVSSPSRTRMKFPGTVATEGPERLIHAVGELLDDLAHFELAQMTFVACLRLSGGARFGRLPQHGDLLPCDFRGQVTFTPLDGAIVSFSRRGTNRRGVSSPGRTVRLPTRRICRRAILIIVFTMRDRFTLRLRPVLRALRIDRVRSDETRANTHRWLCARRAAE